MTFRLPTGHPYVIAEAGVNHDGNFAKAKKLIDIASDAKADAVKFQLFNADELASQDAPLAEYQQRSGEENQYQMLKRLTLSHENYRELKEYAESKGLDFLTTPFDVTSAKFLAELGVKAMKIPSGEVTNLPFLKNVAALKMFTIISTGMSTLEEVRDAVAPFQTLNVPFALLHCVSSYPAPMNEINLRAMETLRDEFSVNIGYSDHTEGIDASVMAAALGAQIIEKHFTVNRNDVGPDHAASLEPKELSEMIRIIRDPVALRKAPMMEEALGTGEKICQPCEMNTRAVARRSLVLAKNVKKGEQLTGKMIVIRRPGTGLPSKMLESVLGKAAVRDLAAGTVLTDDLLAP